MTFSGVRQRCGSSLLMAWLGCSRSDEAMVACGGALMDGQKRKLRRVTVATTTARERGEKYNLLHERFPKLGVPLMVALVCFAQGVG